jgi:fatty acid desaturase
MKARSRPRLTAAAAIVFALLLLVLCLYLRSWGGLALLLVGAAGVVWYRTQVARGEEDADRFFADAGEETRLNSFQGTGFHGASPSEMPIERTGDPTERQG